LTNLGKKRTMSAEKNPARGKATNSAARHETPTCPGTGDSQAPIMNTKTSSERVRAGKLLARLVITVLVLLPCILLGLWLAMQHIPDWYNPPVIPPQEYQRVRDDFEAVFNEISENLMSSEPFTLTISDEQLNDWLAVRGQILPEAAKWLPEYLDQPMIRFEHDMLTVAGTVNRGDLRSVVSLGWKLEVAPDTILVRLARTRTGSLPLPGNLVRKGLARAAGETGSARGRALNPAGDLRRMDTGLEIENRFRWKNGDRLFRITGIESREGVVRLGIEPLDDSAALSSRARKRK
jgi:hypothetical protein